MPRLTITGAGGEIGDTATVSIGAKAVWKIAEADSGAIGNIRWQFSDPDFAVLDYQPTDDSARITAFAGKQETTFFWAKAGTVKVTISASAGGQVVSKSVDVTVTEPEVLSLQAKTTATLMKTPTHWRDDTRILYSLTFGETVAQRAKSGACIDAQIRTGDVGGALSYLQLIKIDRTKKGRSGDPNIVTTSAGFVCDQEFHYGIASGDDDKETIAIAAKTTKTITTEDSPATAGYNEKKTKSYTFDSITVKEEFKTYVMFKPAGGIWVAIGEVHWKWGKTATWKDETSEYELADNAGSQENKTIEKLVAPTRLPLWTGNASTIIGAG